MIEGQYSSKVQAMFFHVELFYYKTDRGVKILEMGSLKNSKTLTERKNFFFCENYKSDFSLKALYRFFTFLS